MKLELLKDLSEGGNFKDVSSENLVRLYDFDKAETERLIQLIVEYLIENSQILQLSSLNFIESLNCNLLLKISNKDEGIIVTEKPDSLICSLTADSYLAMVEIMIEVSENGFNWLCDTSIHDIDFLYSKGGTW